MGLLQTIGTAIGTSVGGPAGGAVGGAIGGLISGAGAEGAARANEDQQRREREEEQAVRAETREAATEAAAPSPEEIAQIENTIATNERDIARKEELLGSVDPSLMEAGKQALQLLKGEEAKTLGPLREQRDRDRVQLEERLRRQLGTGFANSSAGIRALQEFDRQTAGVLAQEQDRSLGRLLGTAQNVAGLSSTGQNIGAGVSLAQLFGGQANRQISAITGTPLVPGSSVDSAGSQFTGQVLAGNTLAQLAGNLSNLPKDGSMVSALQEANPTNQTSIPGTTGGINLTAGSGSNNPPVAI